MYLFFILNMEIYIKILINIGSNLKNKNIYQRIHIFNIDLQIYQITTKIMKIISKNVTF